MAPLQIPPGAVSRLRASLFAACVSAFAFCVGDAIAGSYPFGGRTRDVNDLGNQFVPYHAHLWDLLHGTADGGLLLNWQSGYGSSFLPDLGTYVSSPFALLVALFPRDEIDLAVYVVSVLKISAAAAAMAFVLLTLRPGRWWAAGVLGASYALCGWTVMLASYNPMWLDGLIAFPLLCLVGEWARAGRRPVVSVVVVALCWTANFYTAYMATIGAGLVLIVRLLTEPDEEDGPAAAAGPRGARRWFGVLGRAALSTGLGIGLTAPLLMTIMKGTKLAYPGLVKEFQPSPWADLLGRMLPGTYGFATPSTYLDTFALLLAFALPFHPAVPRRTRTVWTSLVVAVGLSLQWKPTHLLWHAFTTPNGSAYRETFVFSGMLVMAAWLALAHGLPGWRQIGAASGIIGVIVLVTLVGADDGVTGLGTYPMAGVGLAAVLGALYLLHRADRLRHRRLAMAGVALLLLTQVGESALTNAWTDRSRLAAMDDYPQWGQRQTWQRQTVAGAEDWPDQRTDPGRAQTVGNDPLMVGGQGAQYYSSLTADVWTRTLTALGGGWTSRGRSLQSLDNPVTDVLFSVGARLHSPTDPHQHGNPPQTAPPTVTRQAVPPLVTVRPNAPASGYGTSPYLNQEMLLGSTVYTPATFQLRTSKGALVQPGPDGFRVTGTRAKRQASTYGLTASCPAGTDIYFWAPNFNGNVNLPSQTKIGFVGRMPTHSAAVERIGATPAGGRFTLWVRAMERGTVPPQAIGCLDRGRLAAAEQRLATGGATHVQVTDDGISAQLPAGSLGFAVVAAPAITGWSCSAGGGSAHPATSYLGLVAVPLTGGATSISCSFTPPGLHLGEAAGGASLLGVALLAGYGWWRRRRPGAPDSDPSELPASVPAGV
ncbi:YfhO family protein [Streptomyces sp. NPDC051976]|uniref:YfhO family protein n=1 Tax=Streptomyces sp. NPDC051976 TaxID=3154947 RepID=UPI0034255D03